MAEVGVCLVGYGGIAEYHAEALSQVEGARVRTVVGRRPEPAAAFAARWGIGSATTDLDSALGDARIDAVVLASPSEQHHPMAAAALRAGKHVLVEIPLAMSARGGRELVELAATCRRQVMVAHTRRFEPAGAFARRFLVDGRAGPVHQHHSFSFWLRHENVGWTGYRRSWVDDVLFHHGCHLVDYSLWCLGPSVRRVRGELSSLDARTGTSLDVSLLLRYEGGAIATISLSYNARQGAAGERFVCEGGLLEIAGGAVRFGGQVVYEAPEGDALRAGVRAQDREFVDAVRWDRPPSCSACDGLAALEVLQQVYDQMLELDGASGYRRRWDL